MWNAKPMLKDYEYSWYSNQIKIKTYQFSSLGVYFAAGAVLYVYAKVQQKRDPANWSTFIPSPDTVKEEKR